MATTPIRWKSGICECVNVPDDIPAGCRVGREAGMTGVEVDAGMLVTTVEVDAGTIEDAPEEEEDGGVPPASSARSIFLTREPKNVSAAGEREGEEDVVVVVVPELAVPAAPLVPVEVALVDIAREPGIDILKKTGN